MISQKSLVVIIDAHLVALRRSFLRVCKLSLVGLLLLPLSEDVTRTGITLAVFMLITVILYTSTVYFVTRSVNRR